MNDDELARRLADEAGAELLALRERRRFGDPTALRDEADALSHDLLVKRLAETRPDDAVLSEEGHDDLTRLAADRVWIVDPLDGTREYGEAGRTDWAVHVALWERGSLVAGAVALPAQGVTLATDDPPSTPRPHDGPVRMVVSRSRATDLVTAVAETLHAELVPMGSAGAKAAAVIRGDVDAYVHSGGQYEWDSAAPAAVAKAASVFTSRLDGSPLTYNHSDPWLPDLVVCRPDLAPAVLAAIKAATTASE
jgi:3'(2'), 5'-bisphosphate nucleotidase